MYILLLQYVQLIALCLLEQYAMNVKILIALLIVTVCLLRFKLTQMGTLHDIYSVSYKYKD